MNRTDTPTMELIAQIRSGDPGAWNHLVERELPPLRRFARGRLPAWARSVTDTQDLVQDVFVRALPRLASWQSESPGALRAFLRKAAANQIVDEIRKARRRTSSSSLLDALCDLAPSPLGRVINDERVSKLRDALAQLSDSDRKLLAARFGSGYRYAQIAVLLRRPSASAARVAVERALDRVAKKMIAMPR